VHLDSRRALAEQGVREGSSVLIEVLPPPLPPAPPYVLVRRGGSLSHSKVVFARGADAYDLAKAVIAELKLDAAPDCVRLLREVEGGGAPVPLESLRALAEQGVREGSRVVVEVLYPPPTATQQHLQLNRVEAQLSSLAAAVAAAPVSASQLGHTFSEVLARQDRVTQEPAVPGALAVLSVAQEEQLRRVSAIDAEAGVVAFMTPILAQHVQEAWAAAGAAPSDAPVLVNSELFPWLLPPAVPHLPALRYKPDLFLTWLPFAEMRQGGRGQGQGKAHLFGTLAGQGALQREGCVSVVFEAKIGALTRSHFGELAAYLQCFPGWSCGVLFGPEEFWMYSSFNGVPLALRKDAWTAGGSAARLRHFLAEAAAQPSPPLLRLLRRLLDDLRLEPLHLPYASATRCHLGSGASGHVFAARPRGGGAQPLALKVVMAPRRGPRHGVAPSFADFAYSALAKEFQLLCSLARQGAPVVPPVPGSLRTYEQQKGEGGEGGGGYAMACVGTPVAVDSFERCKEAFAALAALHAHGAAHGDARLANLMQLPETAPAPRHRLAGIDVRTAFSGGSGSDSDGPSEPLLLQQLQRADASVLARSVLRVGADGEAPLRVAEAVQQWDASSAGAVAALAKSVWEAAAASSSG
jgi:hypothetical protein